MSRAEAEEFEEAVSTSSDLSSRVRLFRKVCARSGLDPGAAAGADAVAVAFATAAQIAKDVAERRVAEIGDLLRRVSDGVTSPDAFVSGWVALELGRCPVHLGAGRGLSAAAAAGVLLFEGGPCEDGEVPLDAEDLGDCLVLPAGQEKVARALGGQAAGEGGEEEDLPVFRAIVEFEDAPA